MKINQLLFIDKNYLGKYRVEEFFHKSLVGLKSELLRLRETIYNHEKHELIFALNERAWVSALNNAILNAFSNSLTVTLQEYGVYNKNNFIGRADFLVHWQNEESNPTYLLFEAKQYEEISEGGLLIDKSKYLENIRDQGQKYYDAQSDYFQGKTVLIVAIAFAWIRKSNLLSEAKKYIDQSHKKDKSINFCSLYFEEEHGVMVYGKVYMAKPTNV